jgi:hypothetical protein
MILSSNLQIHRDILMMRVMNTITEKPQWDQKVDLYLFFYMWSFSDLR